MLELKHLRTLATLRDTGSLTATATQLHLTQSALSHQLKDLESRIGSPLFLRKTRPVRFTPEGRILLNLADDILPRIHRAEHHLAHTKEDSHGRLHMAIDCHSCFQWLMPAIKAYQQHWPHVGLDFSAGFGFDPLPALIAGELDLVVTSDVSPRGEVFYEPLFDFEMVLVLSPTHPLCEKTKIAPEDLLTECLLSYPVPRQRLDLYKHFLSPANVEPEQWKQADNTLMMVQMVAAGLGVTALPSWAVTPFVEQGLVCMRPLGDGLWRRLFAAVRDNERQRKFVQAFFSTAKQQCQHHLTGIKSV
ncbi:HTH-type transcriptional regulator MetR [Vibrio stylophorae]|uniref:HTH-type transcriptional regulator MetR n=1 Tax=Vibrio stylophorae TaxID=659351 RepID=A0ABN8DSF0_9VIBR|nr:LysR substrate-binding domain-containing protein [Vibrio stylophorae]CAH0533735.1 HTH-type transcriptional regulator MetR [Vibrio stylophorae]